jgi:hypothetical protein
VGPGDKTKIKDECGEHNKRRSKEMGTGLQGPGAGHLRGFGEFAATWVEGELGLGDVRELKIAVENIRRWKTCHYIPEFTAFHFLA